MIADGGKRDGFETAPGGIVVTVKVRKLTALVLLVAKGEDGGGIEVDEDVGCGEILARFFGRVGAAGKITGGGDDRIARGSNGAPPGDAGRDEDEEEEGNGDRGRAREGPG